MDLTILGGAATIALLSAVTFLLVVRSWSVITRSVTTTRFPESIMLEAAQRFRDEIAQLSRNHSVYLATGLVFAVIFCVTYLLPPRELFSDTPRWQLIVEFILLALGAGYVLFRLGQIAVARRRLVFIRDANMATGHALQRLTANSNRVFHDVACNADVIDHVVVGLQGVYTISVIARKPGKDNRARLTGDQLLFAPGKETMSVERSGNKSEQLARELKKLLGHKIRIRPVIAVPGWEIDYQESSDYLLVNERTLSMLTGWKDQKDYLMNEEVDAVQQALTERCTRFRR
jgi:hypothetical protein